MVPLCFCGVKIAIRDQNCFCQTKISIFVVKDYKYTYNLC